MATGPRTAEGKRKVAANAVRHGLTASQWLSEAERADYQTLWEALTAEHEPQGMTEQLMIERIAMGMTKLRRLQRVEDARYAQARAEATVPRFGTRIQDYAVDAAMPPMKLLDTLSRYQTSLERQISKSIGEMMVLKRSRVSEALPKGTPIAGALPQP